MRIGVLRIFIVLAFCCVLGALIYMQVVHGDYYYAQSRSNRIRVIPVDAPRGNIIDRRGVVLADNRVAYHIAIIDQDTDDKQALFNFLGTILDRNPQDLEKNYKRRRLTPFAPVLIAEDVSPKVVFKIEENRFQYPGLMVMQGFLRHYPQSPALAHVIGYVGKVDTLESSDNDYGYTPLSYEGRAGLEKFYDELLRGASGGRQIEINSRGQQVRTLSIKEPADGKRIDLTLDSGLSTEAQRLLGDRRGAVVVMDVATGDVVASVSAPTFNANAFVDRSINEQVTGYFRNPHAPMLDRTVNGQFPPGSIFKIPVALAALQLNKIRPSQSYDCPGYYNLGGRKFACAHVHGTQDLLNAIAHSCNVYFFHVGQILGPRIINAYAKAFGMGYPTGIDLPFEARGRLRSFSGSSFYGGDILNLSIGQGDTLATPVQMMVMMAALATDGVLIQPRLVKAVDGQVVEGQDLKKRPRVKLRPEVWQTVKEGMRMVVTDSEGTGRSLNDLDGLSVWGKTGTAQAGRGKENHAWFAGWAKGKSSTYAFCVFLEHGGSSANAVALTKDLLGYMLQGGFF